MKKPPLVLFIISLSLLSFILGARFAIWIFEGLVKQGEMIIDSKEYICVEVIKEKSNDYNICTRDQ